MAIGTERAEGLAVPKRGGKVGLVELANRNAADAYRNRLEKRRSQTDLLETLQKNLKLKNLPRRIECFDISTLQGNQNVGSMAVIVDAEAAKNEYRHFRIRNQRGNDDYASQGEVLRRRLSRGLEEGSLPDMILIDGGKGQLSILLEVLEELQLSDRIDTVGMAKSRVFANQKGKVVERSEERFFLPGRKNPVTLRQGSPALFLLQRLRDEAHRFAIGYHRKLREKAALASPLDQIPGIGPTRRKALLKAFGSLKKLRQASVEEIAASGAIPAGLADSVYRNLQKSS